MNSTYPVALQSTQYRLARHYLGKLRSANEAVRHGHASASYGFSLFDQEWEQIKAWQSRAAEHSDHDETWTQLCKEFPLAGREILANRNPAPDQSAWLTSALIAAQKLHDQDAERSLCYGLMMIAYRLGMPEKIEAHAHHLMRLGEATNDLLSIERAWFGLGLVAEEGSAFDEAEVRYQRALEYALQLNDADEIAQVLNGLGAVATYRGDYQKAVPYFQRQLDLMEASGKKSEICHALMSMGGVMLWQKDYVQADAYLKRAVSLSQALGLQRLYGVSLIHLGASALEQNQLEAAEVYLQDGLDAVRRVGVVRQITNALSQLGYLRLRMGNPSAALELLQEALQIARESQNPRAVFYAQGNMVRTRLALNDLDAAHEALIDVFALTQKLGGYPQKIEAISLAISYALQRGLQQQAAIWAGAIKDDGELDLAFITPIYAKLEATLGEVAYQQALEHGKTRTVDDVLSEITGVFG